MKGIEFFRIVARPSFLFTHVTEQTKRLTMLAQGGISKKGNAGNPIGLDEDLMLEEYPLSDAYDDEDEDETDDLDESMYFDQWCPDCKKLNPHVAAKDGSHKIICAECNHKHLRHDEEKWNVQPAAKKIVSAAELADENMRHAAWKRLTQNAKSQSPLEYNIRINPEISDIIHHKTFGTGIVFDTLDARKVDVLFEDGVRRLVCGR